MATLTVESRSTTSLAAGSRYRRFRPRLVLGYQQDLQSLIEELTAMRATEARMVLELAIEKLDERQGALQTFGLRSSNSMSLRWLKFDHLVVVRRDRHPALDRRLASS